MSGPERPDHGAGGPRGGAGRDPVVDDEDRPPTERQAGTAGAIRACPVLQLRALSRLGPVKVERVEPTGPEYLGILHTDPVLADRTHGKLPLEGYAQLAHDHDVET